MQVCLITRICWGLISRLYTYKNPLGSSKHESNPVVFTFTDSYYYTIPDSYQRLRTIMALYCQPGSPTWDHSLNTLFTMGQIILVEEGLQVAIHWAQLQYWYGLRSHCLQPNCLYGGNVSRGNLKIYTHMQIAFTKNIHIYFNNRHLFPSHQFHFNIN